MNPIETIEHKGLQVKFFYDDSPESPRDWDNLGTLVCFHRNYDLSDKDRGFSNPDEVMAHIRATDALWLPVYLMDHSGISLSTGAFGCPWDSGQVGVIFIERAKVLKEYSVKRVSPQVKAKALKQLKCEVETMSQYVSGQVYGYDVESPDGDSMDSCWGFYGFDYCKTQALEAADSAAKERETQEQAKAATARLLETDTRIGQACKLLHAVAGKECTLTIEGIPFDVATGKAVQS